MMKNNKPKATLFLMIYYLNVSCCPAFKTEPGSNQFVKVIERSTKQTININKNSKPRADVLPSISVYDDYSHSPLGRPSISRYSDTTNQTNVGMLTPVAKPLAFSLSSAIEIPWSQKLERRKCVGLDEDPAEYWFHNKIHTFGNIGALGLCHALLAPLATGLIDIFAYDRINVRKVVSSNLHNIINKKNARVLDLCCGVGMSTRALKEAFTDGEVVIGVDTSPEMITMAKTYSIGGKVKSGLRDILSRSDQWFQRVFHRMRQLSLDECGLEFILGNAERTIFPAKAFDLVTIMYGFHEAPRVGRYRILREARRVLAAGGTLCVVDITPEYQPSPSMLAGEPYVLEYQKNIMSQMQRIQGFTDLQYRSLIDGHVGMWLLKRK